MVKPTETGLLADAAAAYAFAIARYGTERIVLGGESLGSTLAVALAAEKPICNLVLEAPFTSVADVAARHYWFVRAYQQSNTAGSARGPATQSDCRDI